MEGSEKRNEWLWPLCRLLGLLPMSFCRCQCGEGPGLGHRDYGAPAPASAVAPIAWTKRCPCPPLAPSTSWLVLSLALVLGVVSWTSYNIYINAPDASDAEVALTDFPGNSTTEKDLVGLFDTTSIAFIATVCVLQAAVSQHLVVRLVAQLRKVDTLLPRAPHDVPRWILLFVVWLSFVIVVDIIFKLWWIDCSYAVSTTPSYISYLITYGREAMFVDDVTSVRTRFRTLNQELETVLPFFSNARRRLVEKRRDTLARLSTAYDLLCECVESVAMQYSMFLMCDMLGLLVRLVITTYFIFGILVKAYSRGVEPSIHLSLFVLIQILWLVCHFVRMLVLVTPCSMTMDETNHTGALVSSSVVYEPLDSAFSQQLECVMYITVGITVCIFFLMQLKSVSVHLLHRKIAFSAFGVFDLNLPLVCTVMSAVTTYLVVLLQLQMKP